MSKTHCSEWEHLNIRSCIELNYRIRSHNSSVSGNVSCDPLILITSILLRQIYTLFFSCIFILYTIYILYIHVSLIYQCSPTLTLCLTLYYPTSPKSALVSGSWIVCQTEAGLLQQPWFDRRFNNQWLPTRVVGTRWNRDDQQKTTMNISNRLVDLDLNLI